MVRKKRAAIHSVAEVGMASVIRLLLLTKRLLRPSSIDLRAASSQNMLD